MHHVEEFVHGAGQICILGIRSEEDEDGMYRHLVLRNLGPTSIVTQFHHFVLTFQDQHGARREKVQVNLNRGTLVVEPGSAYVLFSPALLVEGATADHDGRILASDLMGLPHGDISAGFHTPSNKVLLNIRITDFSRPQGSSPEPLLDTFRAKVGLLSSAT